jgi:hypothetical protein
MDFEQTCRYILSGDLVPVHYGGNSTATLPLSVDWKTEAALWAEHTRKWVSEIWAEDWNSPEDSIYDED